MCIMITLPVITAHYNPRNSYRSTAIRIQLWYFARTEISFWNLGNPNQIWIVITLLRQIQYQSELRLMLNLWEKGNFNPNLVWINKIPKRFLCAWFGRHIVMITLVHKLYGAVTVSNVLLLFITPYHNNQTIRTTTNKVYSRKWRVHSKSRLTKSNMPTSTCLRLTKLTNCRYYNSPK